MIGHTTARQQRKLDEARDLMSENKYQKAEGITLEVLRYAPSNIDGRKLLVTMYLEQGRIDQAIQEMRRILQLNPEETETLTELAMLLIERHRYPDAETVIDQALLVDPDNLQLLLLQGEVRERRGADRDALATYYRILGNDPENPQAILRLASIEMRRGRAEQAVPLLRQLAMSSEGSPEILREARLSLVDAYAKRERWDEAASLLGEIAGGEALSNDLQYKLAYVRFRAGLSNEARQSLAEFLARAPHDPRGLELAGQFAPSLLDPAASLRNNASIERNNDSRVLRTTLLPVGHSRRQ